MTRRRDKGNGAIYWSETRQRWVGAVTVGYTALGRQQRRTVVAKTKAEVQEKVKALLQDLERGVDLAKGPVTVAELIEEWLAHGLNGRDHKTVATNRYLAEQHIVPLIGKKSLRQLKASDVDWMLAAHRHRLSTSTLQKVLAVLRRAIRWGQARDMVSRNVAELVTAPTGAVGRPSKAMTLAQARAVLGACDRHPLGAYVTLALLVGVRNEELRAVTWDHVDLDGNPDVVPPVPRSIRVWRSVRAGGDTKTRLSRRTIGLPAQCVEILEKHRAQMAANGLDVEHGLVFCTSSGTPLDSANVRRSFRALCKEAGLDAGEWTPREMRHSFVSLMSEAGVPLEAIARVVGHSSTKVTELVYRKQLRPVLTEGTAAMEALFELPAANRKRSPGEG
jgi:integrase